MEEEKKPTQEELAAEQAALVGAKEDEVREQVIKDYGFDPIENVDLIDKLTKERIAFTEKFGNIVRQKVKIRAERDALSSKPPVTATKPEDVDKLVDAKLEEKLQQRDLDALPYSDDIKTEIKRVAQIMGMSIQKATADPYIAAKVAEYERQKKADDASLGKGKGGGGAGDGRFDPNVPPQVDMNTAEGRKKYDDWKEKAIKATS